MTSRGTLLSFLTAMPATIALLAAVATADAALPAAAESAANILRDESDGARARGARFTVRARVHARGQADSCRGRAEPSDHSQGAMGNIKI